MLRRLVFVTPLLLAACTSGIVLQQGPGIAGTYVVNGVDPVGVEYSGRLEITRGSQPDAYLLDWVITGAILHGEGVVSGDKFDVTWETVNAPGGEASGTASYEVRDDGSLVGTRTVDGFEGVGTEEVFPKP